jgi:hypothetical protein
MPVLVPGQTLASREPTLRVENALAPGSYVFRMTVVDDARNESAPTEITVRVQRVVVGSVLRDPILRDPLRPILRPGGPT